MPILDLTVLLDQKTVLVSQLAEPDPSISEYPGKYLLTALDSDYLTITGLEWSPSSNGRLDNNPFLSLTVWPRKKGKTTVITNVQYNQLNPLFVTFEFHLDIV